MRRQVKEGGSVYLVNLVKLFDALAGREDDGRRVLGGGRGCHYYSIERSLIICSEGRRYIWLVQHKPEQLGRRRKLHLGAILLKK